MLLLLAACLQPDSDKKTDPKEEEAGPLDVTGFGEETYIDESAGDSEAEPSAVALPDGTVLAAWMNLDRYSLYIKWSRSTDGGETWSEAEMIDEDEWGYQNDPVLVAGGDYIYFTWLAVEGSNYDKSSIYCVDSTDGGESWSDPVRLTERNTFNDRQWMAVDDDGHAVITWDYFPDNYLTEQAYSETDGGCAGFAEAETIKTGSFLNGVPAIDTDGRIWTSRTEYDYGSGETLTIVSTLDENGDWDDDTILRTESSYGAAMAMAEDPAEEREERMRSVEEAEERAEGEGGYEIDLERLRLSGGMDLALILSGRIQPRNLASADFDGFYSPVLQPLPDGRLAIAQCAFEEGSNDTPDTWFMLYDHGEVDRRVLNADEPGNEQMEPWMTVDAYGGIHVSWFDAREGEWRLYGATSIDDGETFTEYEIGDATFRKGFDDYDAYAWVGHFQGLTHDDEGVIAIWGDNTDDGASKIRADRSVVE